MTAKDIRMLKKYDHQIAICDERSYHLRSLMSRNIGFREEEEFSRKVEKKFKGGGAHWKRDEVVKLCMKAKFKDNIKDRERVKWRRSALVRKIETEFGKN